MAISQYVDMQVTTQCVVSAIHSQDTQFLHFLKNEIQMGSIIEIHHCISNDGNTLQIYLHEF